MYSRDFGEGIRSEGNFREQMRVTQPETPTPIREESNPPCLKPENRGDGILGGVKKIFGSLEIDDLIIIGLGILLLLDSDSDNDIFVILILLLLFF